MAVTDGVDLLVEPLLHNLQFRVQVAESPSVRQRLVLAEATRIRDLLDYDRSNWVDPLVLGWRTGLSTLRTPQSVLQEVEAALLPASRVYLKQVLQEGAPRQLLTPGPSDLSIRSLPCKPSSSYPKPAACSAASSSLNHAERTTVHTRASHALFPHPRVPPRHQVAGPITSCGRWGTLVGQLVFYPSSAAHQRY
ncbi:unnamed protein product [Eretmochelys imbricata]